MNNPPDWQSKLDLLINSKHSLADKQLLQRVFNTDDAGKADEVSNINGFDFNQASDIIDTLLIADNLDSIGLQKMSVTLSDKLRKIPLQNEDNIFWLFKKPVKRALAASFILAISYVFQLVPQPDQSPNLAEIQLAKKQLTVALNYLNDAQHRSTKQFNQTIKTNLHDRLLKSIYQKRSFGDTLFRSPFNIKFKTNLNDFNQSKES